MRRPEPTPGFPAPSALPGGDALLARWEQLLARSPRLRPWLLQMIATQRALLAERGESGPAIERGVGRQLQRWLRDFEALPQFAVSAIATELQEAAQRPGEPDQEAGPPPEAGADLSPERALVRREALLADPAFALAFHCVEARVRPSLDLSRVPEPAWFGMLHATAPARPRLDAEVAVALVLRVLSPSWPLLPPQGQKAALRLVLAGPADLRATADVQRLCAALPPEWRLTDAPAFVAAAGRARAGLAEASALCSRIVAAIAGAAGAVGGAGRQSLGGLAHLEAGGALPAGAGELAEVRASARRHPAMPGFRLLEALL